MLDLFKYTYDSGIDGPDGDEGAIYMNLLIEVLFADDTDNDLSNGTPNDMAIISAFDLHGITLLSILLGLGFLVKAIPAACLAAILFKVGIDKYWY